MPAEIPLQNPAIVRAIEEGAPRLEFADTRWRFLGMQFGHAPVTQVLATAHCVSEVDAPVISIVDIAHGRGYTTFRHDRVRFAKEGFRKR